MPSRRPVPPELQAGPFRSAEAARLGVTATQLEGARFISPFHGVHLTAAPRNLLEQCNAARLVLPDSAVFSDLTAARILDLPAQDSDQRIHVTVSPPLTAIRRRGMRGHLREITEAEIWMLGNIRFTSAVRTFLDHAETTKRPFLVAMIDTILRARLADHDELALAIEKRSGHRGNDRARAALRSADPRSESPMESILRVLLLDAGLPAPEVNVNLYDLEGCFLARADLYFREARLLVEYDGDQHRIDRAQFAHDIRRGSRLTAAGFAILRFTSSDVFGRPDELVATVAAALRSRTKRRDLAGQAS